MFASALECMTGWEPGGVRAVYNSLPKQTLAEASRHLAGWLTFQDFCHGEPLMQARSRWLMRSLLCLGVWLNAVAAQVATPSSSDQKKPVVPRQN